MILKFTYLMTNSADTDHLASSEANWSESTLFANAGHIQVQQDQALLKNKKNIVKQKIN